MICAAKGDGQNAVTAVTGGTAFDDVVFWIARLENAVARVAGGRVGQYTNAAYLQDWTKYCCTCGHIEKWHPCWMFWHGTKRWQIQDCTLGRS